MSSTETSALHTFYEPPLVTADLHSSSLVEEHSVVDLPSGRFDVKYWIFDGILILYSNHHFNDHYHFEKKNSLDVVSLEFNLRGSYIIYHVGKVYRTKSPQHNIIYSPGFHNTFQNGELKGETIKVQFTLPVFQRIVTDSNDTLKRFAEQVMAGKPVVISQNSLLIGPDLQQVIYDILHCRYAGGLKKLFLLSKSIEILVLQAEAYDRAARSGNYTPKRKDDQERIQYAREYIAAHIDQPPSLSELSRIVGVNEYKLKRSFKETFNTTVFGYLANYRMELAKQALLDDNKTISEIAYELGFSSPQHFSNAFRKKFGIPPKAAKS